ncbi:two-component sensor histidine kinase [Sphaerisporangium melleum]|uniref:Two-component sensor histidine kinase n=1 Tax=Sphaerisporangium melleum TaxID=321316 RepID=A0A917RDA0_9ACTN|nr:sensor histidine kinase [Sphaerisporangium melleum]GGL01721.1 two-component sensor histidine kinase [Sphaerisporangium melleum]GII72155.1 two-component sensor histidine kinase [Sphaerisporangium melleum]
MSEPNVPCRERADRDFAAKGPDARGFVIWLVLLAWPLWEVLQGEARPLWLALPGLAAAGALYLWTIRLAFVDPRRAERGPLPALGALTLVLVLTLHGSWYMLFPMFAIAGGVAVKGLSRAATVLGAATVVACGLLLADGGQWGGLQSLGWGTFTAGLVPAIVLRLFEVIGQLRQTREELARTAVAEERLRFARDLHDLLGHTLSVMVVKAEAVRRVLPSDVAAAAEQAADIERVGREALREVRAAVTGYRGRGLTAELRAARTVLGDAGVALTTRMPAAELPPEADALLGWAVREGVTNLIRHSGARTCEIDLGVGDNGTVLEIRDDGRGGARYESAGQGLRGLRERVTATGGLLDVDDLPAGGFRLRVTIPGALA